MLHFDGKVYPLFDKDNVCRLKSLQILIFYIEDLLKLNMGSSLEVCMYNDFRDRKLSLKSFVILS